MCVHVWTRWEAKVWEAGAEDTVLVRDVTSDDRAHGENSDVSGTPAGPHTRFENWTCPGVVRWRNTKCGAEQRCIAQDSSLMTALPHPAHTTWT